MPKSKTPKKRVVKKKKAPQSTGKQRKEFAVRMLVDAEKPNWQAEMIAAKKIFEEYPLDFLLKIKKPPFKINSCFFFLSEGGREWLGKKLKEFLYKPKSYAIVPGEVKEGEDWNGQKKTSIRDFLK